jgi:hypothetical protein
VARGVRAERVSIAPCHAVIDRAVGACSAAWRDGRCGARGRRGQALVDAKARFRVRAFASLRRLRGRTSSVVRPGRPCRPRRAEWAPPRRCAARDIAEPRQAKPRAWPASGRGAARPGGRPRPQGRDAPGIHGA